MRSLTVSTLVVCPHLDMSTRRNTDAGFIAPDHSDDEPSIHSDDSDVVVGGPSSSRPQRDRRAPKRLTEEQEQVAGDSALPKKRGLVRGKPAAGGSSKGKGRAWEGDFEHTWDNVQEDERGTLEGAVSGALLSGKTRR